MTRPFRTLGLVAALSLSAPGALAQAPAEPGSTELAAQPEPTAQPAPTAAPTPPTGPAQVIGRAKAQAEARRQQAKLEAVEEAVGHPAPDHVAAMPAGHPTTDQAAMPAGHPTTDQAGGMPAGHPTTPTTSSRAMNRLMGNAPPLSSANPSAVLPAGTIKVSVVDEDGQPVPQAVVMLGSMGEGKRTRISEVTGPDGTYTFTGLSTGGSQAYRVSVPHEGAKYWATPFRLPPDRGYEVRITRLPVTTDDRVLLLAGGQTMIEFREERLHVTQHYSLANLGINDGTRTREVTYVFPDEGAHIELPEGFLAFSAQESMSDQKVEADDTGVRISGSIPPGQTTLTWGFDVPVDDATEHLRFPMPWRVFRYQLVAEAAPGMRLDVEGMPPATAHEHNGGRILVTELTRTPADPPLDRVRVTIQGIPGPGPQRWVALGGMLVLVFAGLMLAFFRPSRVRGSSQTRERRRKDLLDEAAELERMHAAGEVGPKYRKRRMEEIVTELAVLLHESAVDERGPASPGKDAKAKPQPRA